MSAPVNGFHPGGKALTNAPGRKTVFHVTPKANAQGILAHGFVDGDSPHFAVTPAGLKVTPHTGVWVGDEGWLNYVAEHRRLRRKWCGPLAIIVLQLPEHVLSQYEAVDDNIPGIEACVPAALLSGAVVGVRYWPACKYDGASARRLRAQVAGATRTGRAE